MNDLILNDREILPISATKFGAIVTEKEATDLLDDGYKVKPIPRKVDEETRYYLEVCIKPDEAKNLGFYLAMAETSGHADLVISPFPWKAGKLSGIKAYIKSFNNPVRETETREN